MRGLLYEEEWTLLADSQASSHAQNIVEELRGSPPFVSLFSAGRREKVQDVFGVNVSNVVGSVFPLPLEHRSSNRKRRYETILIRSKVGKLAPYAVF